MAHGVADDNKLDDAVDICTVTAFDSQSTADVFAHGLWLDKRKSAISMLSNATESDTDACEESTSRPAGSSICC